jgi:hypothetical protein
MSLFSVEIDPRVKVIHVEVKSECVIDELMLRKGEKDMPVKKWEVSSGTGTGQMEKGSGNRLSVMLDYGVEKKYEFTIASEMELNEYSGKFQMPSFNSLVICHSIHSA